MGTGSVAGVAGEKSMPSSPANVASCAIAAGR